VAKFEPPVTNYKSLLYGKDYAVSMLTTENTEGHRDNSTFYLWVSAFKVSPDRAAIQ